MATKDTPLEHEIRKAMTAIDRIAEMLGTSREQRDDALSRIGRYAQIKETEDKEGSDATD